MKFTGGYLRIKSTFLNKDLCLWLYNKSNVTSRYLKCCNVFHDFTNEISVHISTHQISDYIKKILTMYVNISARRWFEYNHLNYISFSFKQLIVLFFSIIPYVFRVSEINFNFLSFIEFFHRSLASNFLNLFCLLYPSSPVSIGFFRLFKYKP